MSMINRRSVLTRLATATCVSPVSWLQLSAAAATGGATRRRCVLIWLDGGPSQLDTLDPKPNAPGDHGGPLRPISTNVAGIQIAESLPKISQLMDRCALIRSMSTRERTHKNGRFHLHTGYLTAQALDFPSMGAVVSHFRSGDTVGPPRYVHLGGGRSHGCSSGFLGARHSPLKVDGQIPFLQSRLKPPQYQRRIELLRELEADQAKKDESLFVDHRQALDNALEFSGSSFPAAFDIGSEPDSVRQRYGQTDIGRACLQARRLLERDVPFIEVNSTHWDMHSGIYSSGNSGIRHKSLVLDQAVSALVLDLESRGLLDETLIVWMGEFGRTPKLGPGARPGRDHYSAAWSTMLIGGGIPGGQVIGKTDTRGGAVIDRPVSAADFLATIYHRIGMDQQQEVIGPGNRPMKLVDRLAKPIPIESLL